MPETEDRYRMGLPFHNHRHQLPPVQIRYLIFQQQGKHARVSFELWALCFRDSRSRDLGSVLVEALA